MNIPNNLALIATNPAYSNDVARILKGEGSLDDHLLWLSKHFPIRVWFREPVSLVIQRRRKEGIISHTFRGFFKYGNSLCYKVRKTGRTGYHFPDTEKIERYEPVIEKGDEFSSFEEFKKKFDKRFITEAEITNLWNHKSSQHGEQYNRNDFRQLSRTGLNLVKRFMRFFKGVHEGGGPGYQKSSHGDYTVLSEFHRSYGSGNSGRDITIEHSSNQPYVHYSSEYPGCGNGRYGLLISEKEYLWLEDD